MRRVESHGHVFYRVTRPPWAAIAYAVMLRLSLAILGALLGAVALTQGWL